MTSGNQKAYFANPSKHLSEEEEVESPFFYAGYPDDTDSTMDYHEHFYRRQHEQECSSVAFPPPQTRREDNDMMEPRGFQQGRSSSIWSNSQCSEACAPNKMISRIAGLPPAINVTAVEQFERENERQRQREQLLLSTYHCFPPPQVFDRMGPSVERLVCKNRVSQWLHCPPGTTIGYSQQMILSSQGKLVVQTPLIVGNPALRIYRLRLPHHLVALLDSIVLGCEDYARKLEKGWRTDLYSLTKQDIALHNIPYLEAMVQPIKRYIAKCMKALWNVERLAMDCNQPHVVKYATKDRHTGVQLHHDKCDITANLCMSRSYTLIASLFAIGTTLVL